MFYPTVLTEKTSIRHVVKDSQHCVCGTTYKHYATFDKRDFKRIQFRQRTEITCPSCKSIIE
ncbi:hypothetical protein [Niallia nealsonii]|uniref:Uncharacterized protein n=1 Tax=Niallia nealsonii TaxID=115979 RepID=A0A2N0Z0V7_9BACI|nr:hypothetical protein [Niallia nealsonii]PKG23137.1 hypothetical protein CWS01_13795 [Niallia nealsonii]